MRRGAVAGLMVLALGLAVTSASPPAAGVTGPPPLPSPSSPPRIVLYGDSLVSEAGQDFATLATRSGASVQVHTYPGTSPCNWFSSMAVVAQSWRPTVALLSFTGDAFAACMGGVRLATPQYFTTNAEDTQKAISIFRAVGAKVVLLGLPADAAANLTQNAAALNQVYRSVAGADAGVTFDDAGRVLLVDGHFTWNLPCLQGEPCTGAGGTNVVRAPDGVHFCPDGRTSLAGGDELCDVYSSGAFRFASAMLAAAWFAVTTDHTCAVPGSRRVSCR